MASNTNKPKRIGTHSGNFHCDDVLACYMLRNHTKTYRNCDIVRTRDPKVWPTLDILVDVGDEFDPINHRFDHHQGSFNTKWDDNRATKLSSAGLVYKYFGKEIVRDVLENPLWNNQPSIYSISNNLFRPDSIPSALNKLESKEEEDLSVSTITTTAATYSDETIELVWQRIYDTLIEELDAVDNGVDQYTNLSTSESNYSISTTLSSRVGKFNPSWNDPNSINSDYILKHFYYAMNYIGYEFRDRILKCINEWLPARTVVKNALINLKNTHQSGQVLMLNKSCPWQDHFWNLIEELKINPVPLYVLFPATNGGWRVRAVPASPFSFESKKPLPESWRAKRFGELDNVAGVDGCVFVHSSGFIGGNQTVEGATQMAAKAIEMEK